MGTRAELSLRPACRFFTAMGKGRYDLIPLNLLHENIHTHSQLALTCLTNLGERLSAHDVELSIEHLKKRKIRQVFIILGWCLSFLLFIPAILAWKCQKRNAQIDQDILEMETLALKLKSEARSSANLKEESVNNQPLPTEPSPPSFELHVSSGSLAITEPSGRAASLRAREEETLAAPSASVRDFSVSSSPVSTSSLTLLNLGNFQEGVPLVGIQNKGCLCFAIAALELIRFTPEYRDLVDRPLPSRSGENAQVYKSTQELQKMMQSLLQRLEQGHLVESDQLSHFFMKFRSCIPPESISEGKWALETQQDSGEFLNLILDLLRVDLPQENLCRVTVSDVHFVKTDRGDVPVGSPVLFNEPVHILELESENGVAAFQGNEVTDLLHKQTQVQSALGNYRISYAHPYRADLLSQIGLDEHSLEKLPLASENEATVQLEDSQGHWHPLGDHVTRSFLMNTPSVLTFCLKRFKSEEGAFLRIQGPIAITCDLHIAPFLHEAAIRTRSLDYELSSILVHEGTDRPGGHYLMYQRLPSGTWIGCDDDHVFVCENFDPSTLEGSYILTYRQKTLEAPSF